MNSTRKFIFTALCISIGIVLPMAFHSIPNAGIIFLPMHIPVLLCGMIVGPFYGLLCGVITPLLSSLLTSMPVAAMLPSMMCELAVYGLSTGLLSEYIVIKNETGKTYAVLILSMLAGRIVNGLLNNFIFKAGAYSLQMWLSVSFVKALPGIAIQLLFIPVLVSRLKRAIRSIRG